MIKKRPLKKYLGLYYDKKVLKKNIYNIYLIINNIFFK